MVDRYAPPPPPPDRMAPILPFDDFMTYEFDWRQNQHLGVVGPTEQGKTNLAHTLLTLRSYVAYLAIKTRDETLEAFQDSGGYTRIYDWPPMKSRFGRRPRPVTPAEMPRRLVWPDALGGRHSIPEQRRVFGKALDDIYTSGGWCPVFDDYWYLNKILKFENDTKMFLANARSNDIPMVICAQRPSGNNLVELFDQTTHLFFFRDNDEPNLRRISGVGFNSSKAIQGFVANLARFQALYVNTRDGRMFRTTAPELKVPRRR